MHRSTGQRSMNVLVVEDEPALRKIVVTALSSCGYDVVGASTGVEALDCVRRARPDLVVLDLELPEMDGWEFLDHFRRHRDHADVPVLVTSATHRRIDGDLGIQAFFAKPFDLEELLDCVQSVLRECQEWQDAAETRPARAR
jgi:two-component system, OmpR family, KDP operon response regulator KdpE